MRVADYMRIKFAPTAAISALALACMTAGAHARGLEIYFIDVEGGQSTLIVTPDRQSLLIDTGWAGAGVGFHPGDPHQARDANRILAAAKDAGIKQIDYLLITHFHDDHDGGVRELSQLLPIRAFVDHGSPSPKTALNTGVEQLDAFGVYASVRSGSAHFEPVPGDRLPLKGVEVTVVSSAGRTLPGSLPHAGLINGACRTQPIAALDPNENPRSTGVVMRYGKFRFLDVGDLSGQPLFDLACPKDKIGAVDVYLVAHHGGADAADPGTFAAFKPRIAVMNNGENKGGAKQTYEMLHQIGGLEDVWQLHLSAAAGSNNFPAETVANLDESTSHWLKLVADEDGSFALLNQRTGKWKRYPHLHGSRL
jgi:competence protein ComEC